MEVSWDDAQEFIERLNAMVPEGRYRLPSEAEWEYAARGGGKRHKWPGTNRKEELDQYAWYNANSGDRIHPVAQKAPNELGLYDMAGNVWEWCQDCWHDNYEGAPRDGRAWESGKGPRVLRGGAWYTESDWLRSAFRNISFPDFQDIITGFRLARISL